MPAITVSSQLQPEFVEDKSGYTVSLDKSLAQHFALHDKYKPRGYLNMIMDTGDLRRRVYAVVKSHLYLFNEAGDLSRVVADVDLSKLTKVVPCATETLMRNSVQLCFQSQEQDMAVFADTPQDLQELVSCLLNRN